MSSYAWQLPAERSPAILKSADKLIHSGVFYVQIFSINNNTSIKCIHSFSGNR